MNRSDIAPFFRLLKRLTALIPAVSLFAVSLSPVTVLAGPTDDTFLDAQWALNNKGSYIYYSDQYSHSEQSAEDIDIDLFEGWETYPVGKEETKEIIVAVIDTGIFTDHPDLSGNIWVNYCEIPGNGTDDDENGYIDDINGWDFYNDDATLFHDVTHSDLTGTWYEDDHGTHIAGIIGAVSGNGKGIVGVASNVNVKIMSLKVNGGKKSEGNSANAVKAIEYAEKMGAKIVNISWGTYSYSTELYETIKNSSMLFVCAAGNDGNDNDTKPMYPASFDLDNVISVTYVNASGKLTNGYGGSNPGGNYGANTVDMAAPGKDILSTVTGGYTYKTGTSMAAPFVSGVAALILACADDMTSAEVRQMILSCTKTLPELSGKMRVPGIPDVRDVSEKLVSLGYGGDEPITDEDDTAPDLEISYIVSQDYDKYILSFLAFDGESGVKSIKYLSGEKTRDEVFEGGEDAEHGKDELIFPIECEAVSFLVTDNAGNENLVVNKLKCIPSAAFILSFYEGYIIEGETSVLKAFLLPVGSTDTFSFESSDDNIATVSETGLITAVADGTCEITVTAQNGTKATCIIHVLP